MVAGADRNKDFANDFIDNFDYSSTPTIDVDWTTLSTNDSDANVGGVSDLQFIEGNIFSPTTQTLRYSGASEGYVRMDIANCGGAFQTVVCFVHAATQNVEFTIPAGVSQVRIWNFDMGGVNSNQNIQITTDGVNFTNGFGDIELSRTPINQTCKKAYLCEGVYFNLDRSEEIEGDILNCKVECNSNGCSEIQVVNDNE